MITPITSRIAFQGAIKTNENNHVTIKNLQNKHDPNRSILITKYTEWLYPKQLNNIQMNQKALFLFNDKDEKSYFDFMDQKDKIKMKYNLATFPFFQNFYKSIADIGLKTSNVTEDQEKLLNEKLIEQLSPHAKKFNNSLQQLIDKYLSSAKTL